VRHGNETQQHESEDAAHDTATSSDTHKDPPRMCTELHTAHEPA
jgi:hypothetical protein